MHSTHHTYPMWLTDVYSFEVAVFKICATSKKWLGVENRERERQGEQYYSQRKASRVMFHHFHRQMS